jgi:acyl phosphate:glycerol-3-phosphate acyltransferase
MIQRMPLNLLSNHIVWLLFALGSYLLCAIPFGKLLSRKVAGIDITRQGSGNVGATNVARVIGFKWGILTLFLDALKGFIPVYVFKSFSSGFDLGLMVVVLAALLGHQFSIFQKFRGGKGVATALGIYLAISTSYTLIVLVFFILAVYVFDFVSLGSLLSTLLMPLLLLISGEPKMSITTAFIVAALIWFKHKENIKRLFRGEEKKWKRPVTLSADQAGDPVPHRNKNG